MNYINDYSKMSFFHRFHTLPFSYDMFLWEKHNDINLGLTYVFLFLAFCIYNELVGGDSNVLFSLEDIFSCYFGFHFSGMFFFGILIL